MAKGKKIFKKCHICNGTGTVIISIPNGHEPPIVPAATGPGVCTNCQGDGYIEWGYIGE